MALILSTFDIEVKDIFVIPWQNPISSYMVTDSGRETVTGSHISVTLSFDLEEEGYTLGYTLTGYWQPRDGG